MFIGLVMEQCGQTLGALFIEFTQTLLTATRTSQFRRPSFWWDVTAAHRVTGIFITEEWTTVQFCPQPDDYPNVKVWTNVRHWYRWWAAIVNPGNEIELALI